MLKRNDVIDRINDLNLPENEYWVLSRAALLLHGVRFDTQTIEIGCTNTLYKEFLKSDDESISKDDHSIHINNGEVTLIQSDGDEIEYIENIPVANLDSIRNKKEGSKIEEDIKDIELINKLSAILETF